jgi:competence protein ComEA
MDLFDKIKEFINYYKINLLGGVILVLIMLVSNIVIYSTFNNKLSNIETNKTENILDEKEEHVEQKTEEIESKEYYSFEIKGAVNNPGVYTLEKGKRIIDAINIAGGLKENANTSVNNLSKKIKDEMVIIVYTYDEVVNFSNVKEEAEQVNKECIHYNTEIKNDSCIEEDIIASEVDAKVSINTADIQLLMTIPGIGESKARSIIEYRESNGLFKDIIDIKNVSGIGEALFEKIKDYITV